MKNIFDLSETKAVIDRINNLKPLTKPLWGTMRVDQMLAHCNVTYEMVFEDIHPKPGAMKKALLKLFVKSAVVNEKPYKNNSRTAPQFLMNETKNFVEEKARLMDYLTKTQSLGAAYFEGKESHSFGELTTKEWSNLFYKHLNHHLNQFGV